MNIFSDTYHLASEVCVVSADQGAPLLAESSGRLLAAVNLTSSLVLSRGRVWVSGSACQAAVQLARRTAVR